MKWDSQKLGSTYVAEGDEGAIGELSGETADFDPDEVKQYLHDKEAYYVKKWEDNNVRMEADMMRVMAEAKGEAIPLTTDNLVLHELGGESKYFGSFT